MSGPERRGSRPGDFYDQDPGPEEGYHGDGYEHYDEDYAGDLHDVVYADPHDHYADGWTPPSGSGGRGAHARSRSRSRRSGSGHPVLTGLAIVVLIVFIVVGGGLVWANSQINPGGHRGPTVTVVIPKGASKKLIGQRLARAGVIHDGTLFAYYTYIHGDGPLLPGTYQLPKNSPYSSVIRALEAGPKIVTANLVVPEGYTVAQIARAVAALPNMGLSAQRFIAAADDGTVRSPYEPAGVNNLEGLLFPATYLVTQGESEVKILEQMVGAFDDHASALGLDADAAKLGMTPYQVVIVASIVEREAKLAADRPDVSSTIYNRLRIGMKLGADSTQTYYLRLTDPGLLPTAAQLDRPSPYNTRTNKGLPPTPIANPGLAALGAAAQPPTTKYLFFVEINPDGKLGFASTEAGFTDLQRQCRAAALC